MKNVTDSEQLRIGFGRKDDRQVVFINYKKEEPIIVDIAEGWTKILEIARAKGKIR